MRQLVLAIIAVSLNSCSTAPAGVTHPLYGDASQVAGRGVGGVSRLDVEMSRK